MKSFKEWIGKSLLLRLEHSNAKYKELEARYAVVKRIGMYQSDSSDRKKLIELVENKFEVYEGESISTVGYEHGDEIIWNSLSVDDRTRSMEKSYDFKIVNNKRIIHGNYRIENYTSTNMDEIGYYYAQFTDNIQVSDSSRGPVWDTVDQSKPFYPGCEMINIVK